MEAQELRIGNLISRRDFGNGEERFETIIELGKKAITTGPIKVICDYDDIKPIPLTEEWLLKLGFEKQGDTWHGLVSLCFDDNGDIVYDINDPYEVIVKTVNQLQNLCFALTGEELTIKETA